VDAYLLWRAGGFDNVTRDSVAHEAATGKARLLAQRDMVRAEHSNMGIEPIPDSRCFFTAGSPSRPGESCSAVHGHTSACGAPSQRGIRNVTALTIFGSPGYGAPLRSSHGPCVAADARGGPCTDGVDHI